MTDKKDTATSHRQELLGKLESIIKILNDQVEDSKSIPVLEEAVDLSALIDNGQLSDSALEALSNPDTSESRTQKTSTTTAESPNQQHLFEKPTQSTKNSPHIDKAVSAKMENPFLPRHMRKRHTDEDQQAEHPTDTQKSGTGSSKNLHDSIIDNLIAFYLPKIEADLRRRLKALAARESQKKVR